MGEQLQRRGNNTTSSYAEEEVIEDFAQQTESGVDSEAVDELLGEIDDLLSEVDADTFVQNFIQKGGQ